MDNYQITSYSGAEIEALLVKIDELNAATPEADGLMSAADKAKLDGVNSGAEVNRINRIMLGETEIAPTEKVVTLPLDPAPVLNGTKLLLSGAVYHALTNYYTKAQVDALISDIKQFSAVVVATLPESGEQFTLYLVGPTGTGADKYEEYIWNNDAWLKIGDTSIDLSGYATKEELSQLGQEVAKKVDKMGGKNLLDLSTLTLNKSFNATGAIIDNSNYHITDFIPCEPSTTYCYSRKGSTTSPGGSQYVVFYNSSKERISQLGYNNGLTFTTPAEAAFMRNTLYKNYVSASNETMIEKGTERTSYEPFNPIGGYTAEKVADDSITIEKINKDAFDSKPTESSPNLITSGGVFAALANSGRYAGVAYPSTTPTTNDNIFYLANTPGIYTNFDGIGLERGESAFLSYNGEVWSKQTIKKDERKKLYVEQQIDLTPSNWSILGDTSVQADNGGLKISCVENGSNTYHFASIPLASTIDVSNSWIGIDFDILEGADTSALSTIDSITIILSTYDSFTVSSWYSRNAQYSLLVNAAYIGYAGNYKTSVSLYTQHNNRTLSIDKTAIKSIGVLIRTKAATGTPSIRVNKLFTYRKPEEAQVIIGFDNIYATQQSALDYLKANGFRGTLFFGAATVGQATRFTLSELKSLQADGHLLASYGRIYPEKPGDPVAWYNMSLSQKISAIRAQVNWHYKNGFGKGARCFSTPAGGWSADEAILWESGLVSLITGRINYTNDGRAIGYYGPYAQGHSCGPSAQNADGTLSAGRYTVIDSICANGGFAIFIFHNVNGEASQDITLQEFKDFVDYVKTKADAGLLEVVTAEKLSRYELSEPNI